MYLNEKSAVRSLHSPIVSLTIRSVGCSPTLKYRRGVHWIQYAPHCWCSGPTV